MAAYLALGVDPGVPTSLGDDRMRPLIYSMGVSLDGYIAGPRGEGGWAVPDAELHRFHNEQARELDLHLLGRRLYEVDRKSTRLNSSHPSISYAVFCLK